MSPSDLAARLEAKAVKYEGLAAISESNHEYYRARYCPEQAEEMCSASKTDREFAADLRAAAAAVRAMEWRPIEEAPKDGWFWIMTKVWGPRIGRHSLDKAYDFEFFEPKFAGHITHHLNAVHAHDVTNYLPLPAPPEATR